MKEKVLTFFYYLSLICFIFLVIDGMAPQIEMFIFNGYYHQIIRPKVLLFASLLILFVLSRKVLPERNVLIPYLLLLSYITLDAFLIHKNIGLADKFYGIKWYFSTFLIMPLFFYLPETLDETKILRIIKYISIPVLLLGFLQIYFNSPIVFTHSVDEKFIVYSLNFAKSIRPFSLFGLPSNFSYYVIFLTSMIIYRFNSNNMRDIFINILLLSILFFLNYRSTIRAGYILTAFVLLSVFVYRSGILKNYWKYMPLLYILFGLTTISVLFLNTSKQRIEYWENYVHQMHMSRGSKSKEQNTGGEIKPQNVSTSVEKQNPDNKIETQNVNTGIKKQEISYVFEERNIFLGLNKMVDNDSFATRLAEWKVCFNIVSENWTKFMFGTGYLQSVEGNSIGFPIDNFYINILVYSGITGLFIFLYFAISFYRFLLKVYTATPSSINLSIISLYVSSFVSSFFGGAIGLAFLYSFFVFFLKENIVAIKNLRSQNI